jgi:hypothetical protein
MRHARHFDEFETSGKIGAQGRRLLVERLPELDHVAARLHRHADAEHGLAAITHLRRYRIVIAAFDGGNIAEAKRAVVDADQRVGERVDVFELAGRAHEHAVVEGGQGAGRRHAVLRIDRLRNLLRRDVQTRELRVGDLDVDMLVRIAEVIDLGHTRHTQQHCAQFVRIVVQLCGGKAVTFERIDVGVDIAEFVIEERTLDALRQRGGDIADLLAHLVPGLRHFLDGRGILHREEHQRFAGARIAAHEVDIRRFLQLAADAVGHLFLHLARGGAGPEGADHHHAERERRVFRLREFRISEDSEGGGERDQKYHQRLMTQRPRGQVEASLFVFMRCAHEAKSSGCSGAIG